MRVSHLRANRRSVQGPPGPRHPRGRQRVGTRARTTCRAPSGPSSLSYSTSSSTGHAGPTGSGPIAAHTGRRSVGVRWRGERQVRQERFAGRLTRVTQWREAALDLPGQRRQPRSTLDQAEREDPGAAPVADRVRAAEPEVGRARAERVGGQRPGHGRHVGVVTEELHGEVPLLPSRRPTASEVDRRESRLDRVEHGLRRTYRDERPRHGNRVSRRRRDRSRCPRDRA